jgi:4-hydroxythreonine-4-phosphate dehydrogenase
VRFTTALSPPGITLKRYFNKLLTMSKKIKVGITHGDPNGIGYEVILKTLSDQRITELCTPIVYGSAKIASYYRKGMELPQVQMNTITAASQAKENDVNIINVVGEDFKIEPGVASKTAGEAAFAALERAVTDLRSGEIDVLVTAPINKETIQSDTFTFPGHTEYLQSSLGDGKEALMILANERLRIALVTTHLPIAKIADAITQEAVIGKLRIFNDSLKRDFDIDNPRIAVLSLNPHAGDNGLLGNEETEIIAPAIEQAHEEKIFAFGPYAADGFFGTEAYRKFDGVLAMYHDQGLAPFKTIAMDSGVNFTAGLPYVRTSPDHGTGFDIANQGKASEESMRQAIYMAIDTFRSRQRYEQAYANPLRRQYFDKGKDNVVLDLTKDDSTAQ